MRKLNALLIMCFAAVLASTGRAQTPGGNNAELSGDYAFTFDGFNVGAGSSYVFDAVGRFRADGAGNLTNGELDTNGVAGGAVLTAQTFTGTYAIGADHRGVMTFNTSQGGSARLAFAMMANGNAQFIKFDASGGTGIVGSGTIEKADTTAYNTAKITGDYAFGVAGFDASNSRAALAGRFTANGAGAFANGAADINEYGSTGPVFFTTANYAVSDTSSGRGTINLACVVGGVSRNFNFVFYVVNAGKLFAMETDAVTGSTQLLNGLVLQQQAPAGGFSNSSLSGGMVIYLTTRTTCGNGAGPTAVVLAGLLTADGNGALTLTYDHNCGGIAASAIGQSGTYSAASNGRTAIRVGTAGVVAYLVGSNHAFLLGTDSSGFVEPQTAGSFTNSAVMGTYAGSATTPATSGVVIFSGEFTADGASPTGNITGSEDIGAPSGPISGSAFRATYSISSSPTNGRGTMTVISGSGGSTVAYVVSPSKFVAVPLNDPNPSVWIFERFSPPSTVSFLSSLTLSPSSVTGGNSSTGTVTLSGPAPSGGAVVSLSSSNASVATVPSSVTVPAGATSATFTVSTSTVTTSTSVTISASYGGGTKSASLTVTAASNYTLSASPNNLSITQGASGTSTVTVTPQSSFSGSVSLSASGLPSGVTASFSPNPATTTSTLTLAASSTATTGTVTVTITGTSGSLTNTTTITLTVNAPPLPTLSSLTLNPTSVIGGAQSSTGTVTLSGPAPSGGAVVSLSSSNTSVATVPSSVTVPAGATSATFTVNTSAVLLSTSVQISASYNSTTQTASLAVLL